MRILLVEDDLSLGDTIKSWLELDGYVVDWVQAGHLALSALKSHEYVCVLLDRGLPNITGDDVLRQIRRDALPVAVLMITAQDTVAERVAGLDLGADDYLIKPFDLDELSARIRAAVRRQDKASTAATLNHGGICLDPAAKRVTYLGEPITLTHKEYIVLHRLMLSPTHIVSKQQLEDALYGWGEEIESNAIEVYVSHLRKKLGSDVIITHRRQGYRLGCV